MPTYQYECAGCGHSFEFLQSMTDKKLKKCPKCSKPKLTRLVGAGGGIIFKGTGFYETDYKRKEPAPSAPAGHCHSGSCGCAAPKPSPTAGA